MTHGSETDTVFLQLDNIFGVNGLRTQVA
jgi:hypothetical protein